MARQCDKVQLASPEQTAVETHRPEPGGVGEGLTEEVTFQLSPEECMQSSSGGCGGELIPTSLTGTL